MFDLVIIGAGAAGLTAAIYSARAGIDFLILDQDGFGGGQISSAHIVDNYPGLSGISGEELANALREHAENSGAVIEFGIVKDIVNNNSGKTIILDDGSEIETQSIIIATGSSPKKLGVPGEEALIGKGVSYCAVCDGAFFKGKDTVVTGGGDTAVEDAIYLSEICNSVTLIHRRDSFRASKTRVDLLKSIPNIKIRYKEKVNAIIGGDKVTGVEISGASGTEYLNCDAVFVAVGSNPELSFLNSLSPETENGYIKASEDCKTNIEGIFAAGDIRTKSLRQVVTSTADGANAVVSALEYISSKKQL